MMWIDFFQFCVWVWICKVSKVSKNVKKALTYINLKTYIFTAKVVYKIISFYYLVILVTVVVYFYYQLFL